MEILRLRFRAGHLSRLRRLAFQLFALLALATIGPPVAVAERMQVDFGTGFLGSQQDPFGLLSTGWTARCGFIECPVGVPFSGYWTYESSAVDLNPLPHQSLFRFDDPNLRIHVDAGGLAWDFQLTETSLTFSDPGPDFPYGWGVYRIFGTNTDSMIPGIAGESIIMQWSNQSLFRSRLPAVDTADPVLGSPWETELAGNTAFRILGVAMLSDLDPYSGPPTNGSVFYSWSKGLNHYKDPFPAPIPEPSPLLLLGSGLAGLVGTRGARRLWDCGRRAGARRSHRQTGA